MDRDRWRRMQSLLDEVLDLTADERRRRLDVACADDLDLRAAIETLLEGDARASGLLDGTTLEVVDDARGAPGPAVALHNPAPGDRLLPGTRVAGRYRIVSLLGRGGMGEVYRADDVKLGQAVALKFLPRELQDNPEHQQRLLAETKLARQVSHLNVCRVYDIGEWHDRHFLSMEYIDGEDLASLITRIGHLPRQKALDIARQLCAGLDAAHHVGILHRDLKPSNVMLDGRGQVRVTDFGLAVAVAELRAGEARAGTPAYMAPEQLDGREATARSDVYALGLVLYELFTGRRAFRAATIQELRRLQEESSPTQPSSLVEDFDPGVERAILRCLEKDPALRPASAREVAALLPGGDPLAGAIAAGETPSPDIIAASGPEGTLRPATAFATLGAIVAMLVVLTLLSDRTSILGWILWPRSADALEDNARGILARLGHDSAPLDRAHVFFHNSAWFRYVSAHDRDPARWAALRQPGQYGMLYFYRHAPTALVPEGRNGVVSDVDPEPRPGDAQVVTDLLGRLIALDVVPNDAEPPAASTSDPDWPALFREAGLDRARFQPIAPTRNPRVTADARAAWAGVLADFREYPVHAEAAWYRGKPVFFELVVPWDSYWDPAARAGRATSFPVIGYALSIVFTMSFALVLAIQHWMTGKGDRNGALRVAIVVFVLRFAVWLLGGHHAPSIRGEWTLLLVAVGRSLTAAAFMWCIYLALEPHGRRLHPRLLISWTRVLRGRLRDPLVGRHLLFGVLFGTLVILLWGQLYVLIPHLLAADAPPPPTPHPMGPPPLLYLLDSAPLRTLLGGRHVLEAIPAVALGALTIVLVWTMILLGLHLLLRRNWAAAAGTLALGGLLAWPSVLSDFNPIAVICSLAGTALALWALRFGLVGTLALWFCVHLWMDFPVTANVNAPHFGTGLVAVLTIAALATYGAVTASWPARMSRP